MGIPVVKNYLFTEDIPSVFGFLANIGIILLFFFVGLEINLKGFNKNVKKSAMISLFNTLIPLVVGIFVATRLFHFDMISSIVIGISLSVSSQAISLDILEEAKLLKSKIGNLVMTAGAIDDVFELVAISTVLVILQTTLSADATLKKLVLDIAVFVLIILILRISLIPMAINAFEKDKSQDILFMGALIIVLFMAYLSELFGISSLIGSLVAGMLVRQTFLSKENRRPWKRNEISHLIHVISFGFLIPIFFVNVGVQTDIYTITSNISLAAVLILIDLGGTVLGSVLGVLLSKGSFTEGHIVGWAVSPKGDTELVIASLAFAKGIISINIYSAIIVVALVSTLVSPIMFKYLIRKHSGIAV